MNENQKKCIREIQEVVISINDIVEKYGLSDEFLSCIAVGFLDMDSRYTDEYGGERADMNLLSSFSVTDEDELDDLLSYCVEAYRMDANENSLDSSSIDYWINLSNGDNSVN